MVNLLASRAGRRTLFTALYVSEGAPIGFIWWALPTRLRAAGVDVAAITSLTSLLVLPWVFKFAWSPLVDGLRTSRWTLRSWILLAQAVAGLALLPLAGLDLAADMQVVVPLLLVSTVAAATQDAAIDALAISSVPGAERGSINGWMQAGMLAGRSALGGGTLLLEEALGFSGVVLVLVGTVWCSSFLLMFSHELPRTDAQQGGLRRRLRDTLAHLRSAARGRTTWYGLLFALIAGAGFESVGAVAGPFLLDRGWSSGDVGWFFAVPAVAGMAGGAMLGGHISDRIGLRRAVAIFLLLLSASILLLAVVATGVQRPAQEWILGAMTLLYACIGMFTASSYALFMSMTDPSLGATQFSAFMGATNGCEAWAGFLAGRLAGSAGYGAAFLAGTMLSMTALPLLRRMRRDEHPPWAESHG